MNARRTAFLLLGLAVAVSASTGCATTSDIDALRAEFKRGVLSLQRSVDGLEADLDALQTDQRHLADSVEQRVAVAESKVDAMDDRVAELRLAFSELIRSLRDARKHGFRWDDPTEQAN